MFCDLSQKDLPFCPVNFILQSGQCTFKSCIYALRIYIALNNWFFFLYYLYCGVSFSVIRISGLSGPLLFPHLVRMTRRLIYLFKIHLNNILLSIFGIPKKTLLIRLAVYKVFMLLTLTCLLHIPPKAFSFILNLNNIWLNTNNQKFILLNLLHPHVFLSVGD